MCVLILSAGCQFVIKQVESHILEA